MCKFRLLHFVSIFPTKLALTEPSFWRFYSVENVLNDELSNDISSSCDVESVLQQAGGGEGSFNSIVQRYRVGSWKKES